MLAPTPKFRWTDYLDPNIKRHPWTREEEDAVREAHGRIGDRWADIANFLPGRTDDAIEEHWYSNMCKKTCRDSSKKSRDGQDMGMAMNSTGGLNFGGCRDRVSLSQHADGVACGNDVDGNDNYTLQDSDSYFFRGSHDGLASGGAGVAGTPVAFEEGAATSSASPVHPTSPVAPELAEKASAALDRIAMSARPTTDIAFVAAGKRNHSQVCTLW